MPHPPASSLVTTAALLLVAACATVPSPRYELPPPEPLALAELQTEAAIEEEILRLVNLHRVGEGLPPLRDDPVLAAIARRHSRAMTAGRPYGHHGFDGRLDLVGRTIPGAVHIAENVAANNQPPEEAALHTVSRWISSRGHRDNIEGTFGRIGVGVVRDLRGVYFYTQIFLAVEDEPDLPLLAVGKR
jgi:uncharacterized protein YkwD